MLIRLLLAMVSAVLARIEINVIVENYQDVRVDMLGFSNQIVKNDKKLELFNISTSDIYSSIEKRSGMKPEKVFTYHQTVHPENDWLPVTAVLVPKSFRLIKFGWYPTIIANPRDEINLPQDVPINYTTFHAIVYEEMSFEWPKTPEKPDIDEKIYYSVDLGAIKNVLMSNNFWGSNTFGANTSHYNAQKVENMLEVGFIVPPHQTVNVSLWVKRYKIDLELDYTMTLIGNFYCKYKIPFQGRNDWMYNIHQLLRNTNMRRYYEITQYMSISFDGDLDITVYNVNNNKPLPFDIYANNVPNNTIAQLPRTSSGTRSKIELLLLLVTTFCPQLRLHGI